MAILNSCCCWKSVRRGSYAVAVYSVVYNMVLFSYLWPETHLTSPPADYPANSVIVPEEKKRQEHHTVLAHLSRAMFVLSLAGLLACLLLFIGLCKDRPWLLLPWIVVAVLVILVDVIFVNYILWQNKVNPVVAITFTVDFFFLVLNVNITATPKLDLLARIWP
ncbi:uncharacterized protein LOC126982031 [Eriocheir sinensis]|uniref:uncharacterized protein LOC126982031 n=1 Tax=Eriocheir sinensis TaxID=95602 RepID=UPI0021C9EA3B|nr:uncharacterized protein LOC126982031 [Eriocheir sinensis]